MFGKKPPRGEARIREIESLTAFCWEIVDMYHQGQGPTNKEPMSPSLAKGMIADEINRTLGQPLLDQEWRHVRLRIAGTEHVDILEAIEELAPGRVVTARWLGARDDEDDLVLYATIKCDQIVDLAKILRGLEEKGLEVRDGTFGLFVR
jgi:hypothetical protein